MRMYGYVSHQDVAQAAGVTQSTVSRVLSGKAEGSRITPMKDNAESLLSRYDPKQHHLDLLFMPRELANQAFEVTARPRCCLLLYRPYWPVKEYS